MSFSVLSFSGVSRESYRMSGRRLTYRSRPRRNPKMMSASGMPRGPLGRPTAPSELEGLLADLLGDRAPALPEEVGAVRALGKRPLALAQQRRELGQRPRDRRRGIVAPAGRAAGVADRSRRMRAHEDRIPVAVGPQLDRV